MTTQIDPPLRLLVGFQARCDGATPDFVVAATGRAAWAAVRLTGSAHYTLHDADSPRRARFSLASASRHQTLLSRPLPAWARYAAGVTALCGLPLLPGADLVLCADEPLGPRRSHALGMAIAAVWHQVNQMPLEEDALFQLAERARRDYVELAAPPTVYGGHRS